MEDLKSWWEVPSIAHFCSLFRAAFNLLDFDIEELEEGLVTNGQDNDNYLIKHLILSLLQGYFQRPDVINDDNREKYLAELIGKRWAEEKKDFNVLKGRNFASLSLRSKVEILYSLCDYRLDAADVMDVLKNLESDSLRVEPLGKDDTGATYWYFYGTRLYKEESPSTLRQQRKRHREREKLKKENQKKKRKKERRRMKRIKKDKTSSKEDLCSDSEIEMESDYVSKTGWSVVCSSESDWKQLAEKFSKSEKGNERELHRRLIDDFIPEIGRIIQDRERNTRKRLVELAPRRISHRIEKIREQEREYEVVKVETEQRRKQEAELHRQRQEEIRKRREAKERQERLLERMNAKEERARRARLRQDKGICPDSCSSSSSIDVVGVTTTTRKKSRNSFTFVETEEDLSTGMYKVFETIQGHRDAWPFLEPVDQNYAPNYYDVVKRPMDMSAIEKKLHHSHYSTKEEFVADVNLMFDNCLKYNGPNNEYTTMAQTLKGVFSKAMKRFFDDYEEDYDSSSSASSSEEQKSSAKWITKTKDPNPTPKCVKPPNVVKKNYNGSLRAFLAKGNESLRKTSPTKINSMLGLVKPKTQLCDNKPQISFVRQTENNNVCAQLNGRLAAISATKTNVTVAEPFKVVVCKPTDFINKVTVAYSDRKNGSECVTVSSAAVNAKPSTVKTSIGYHRLPVSVITATAIRAKTAVARTFTTIKSPPNAKSLLKPSITSNSVVETETNTKETEIFDVKVENDCVNEVVIPEKVSVASGTDDAFISNSIESRDSSSEMDATSDEGLSNSETAACESDSLIIGCEETDSQVTVYEEEEPCDSDCVPESDETTSQMNIYSDNCVADSEIETETHTDIGHASSYVLQNGVVSEHSQSYITIDESVSKSSSSMTMSADSLSQQTYVVMNTNVPQVNAGQYAQLRLPVSTMLQTAVHSEAAFQSQTSMVATSGGNLFLAPGIQTVQLIQQPIQFSTYQMQPQAIDTTLYRQFTPLQQEQLVVNPHTTTLVSQIPQHMGPKMLPSQPATILQVYPNVLNAPVQTHIGQYYGALQRPT